MRKYIAQIIAAALLLPATLSAAPVDWVDSSGLVTERNGQVRFDANDGNELLAYTYRSTNFNPSSGPIWFVIHGTDRDATHR